jgi:hypothetical protein
MPFVTLHDDGSPATWCNDVPTKGGIKAIHADRRRGEASADMLVDALVADDAKGCIPLWLVINAIVDDAIKRRAKGGKGSLPPDPVFALSEEHRIAYIAHGAVCAAAEATEAQLEAASIADRDPQYALTNTTPTTIAGAAALLKYAYEHYELEGCDPEIWDTTP